MEAKLTDTIEEAKRQAARPTVSTILPDGSLVEMVCQENRTLFCVSKDGAFRYETNLLVNGQRLAPYSPRNNLLVNEVVLFPTQPLEYASEQELAEDIRAFIHRYVDISPLFEQIASYYVLFTWVYDAFNELPYLRLRGDTGSGKTRFLLTIGSLCYKPIFASGASTVSPIFRMLDAFRGTLIIDESDFRFSDEKAEIVKILNNGNVKGFPVLRSEQSTTGEFNPRAYRVFGPKIVATRGFFDDRALESRFLSEEMGQSRLRDEVPINLPGTHKEEALHLRNKLLLFRFRNFKKQSPSESLVDRSIEPRLNQIFVPLLSIVADPKVQEEFRGVIRQYHRELVNERGQGAEAQVLEVIQSLLVVPETTQLTISDITSRFTDLYASEYDRKITHRWIGYVLRKRLGLKTERTRDGYVIAPAELVKLPRLYEKYGLQEAT